MRRRRSPLSSLDVRCFPAGDDAFASLVRAVVREARCPEDVETVVRIRYPLAHIRLQDPLAAVGLPAIYAFRDGSAVPR